MRSIVYKWLAFLALACAFVFLFALLDASIKQSTDKLENGIDAGWQDYIEIQSMLFLMVPIIVIFVYYIYHLVN